MFVSLSFAEAEAVIAKTNLDRVAEGGEAEDFHWLALKEAHFQQPLGHGIAAPHVLNAGPLADPELIEGEHRLTR